MSNFPLCVCEHCEHWGSFILWPMISFRYMPRSGIAGSLKVEVLVAQSCPTLCDPMECSPPGFSVHGILQVRVLEWITIPFSRGSSWPRNWTWVSHIADRFFTFWATRELRNIGVGSLSLLQGIFLTQESNWGLLHYRQILYQLSYQGSPQYCCLCCISVFQIYWWGN